MADDKIECRICGKKLGSINALHLRVHGISLEECSNRFPAAPLTSASALDKRSRTLKQMWDTGSFQGRTGSPLNKEAKKMLSQKTMGHEVSFGTRKKISETMTGRPPANRNKIAVFDPSSAPRAEIAEILRANPSTRFKILKRGSEILLRGPNSVMYRIITLTAEADISDERAVGMFKNIPAALGNEMAASVFA